MGRSTVRPVRLRVLGGLVWLAMTASATACAVGERGRVSVDGASADETSDAGGGPSVSDGGIAAPADGPDVPPPTTSEPGLDARPPNRGCVATDDPPQMLSETGCFSSTSPLVAVPGVIPYDVRAPFHTDYLGKARWMAIPDGSHVTVTDDGDFLYPPGSVVIKEFRMGETLLETRFLTLGMDGQWAGYSYVWNDSGTDARLSEGGTTLSLGEGRVWDIPTRNQCFRCHNDSTTHAVGVESAQLNMDFTYPSTGRTANQLDTLAAIGVFDREVDAALEPSYPDFEDTSLPLEDRARSYLHANCAHCHRPGGRGSSAADFRYGISLAEMQVCNVEPYTSTLGVEGAMLLVPGDPSRSLLSLRMHAEDDSRMPPLGTRVPDDPGIALVDAWIESIDGCL